MDNKSSSLFDNDAMSSWILIAVMLSMCFLSLCCVFFCYARLKRKKNQKVANKNGLELTNINTNINQYQQSIMATSPMSVSSNGLHEWLQNIDMLEYFGLFAEHGFDSQMQGLKTLSKEDLKEMGIHKIADRNLILEHIAKNNQSLNEGEAQMNTTAMGMGHKNDESDLSSDSMDGQEEIFGGTNCEKKTEIDGMHLYQKGNVSTTEK